MLTKQTIVYMNTEEPLRLYVTREENKGSNVENMYREDRDSGKLNTLYTNILNKMTELECTKTS
jgi:hypothetical protein